MHLHNVFTCLAIPVLLFTSASALASPRRSIESLTSDANLATDHTISSSTDQESGEKSFYLYTGSPVLRASFWSRRLDGKQILSSNTRGLVVNRILLQFQNRQEQGAGVRYDYNGVIYHYDYGPEGKFFNMTIYAGSFVDGVSYTTKRGTKRIGGSGGTAHEQDVGDGVLMGFKGTVRDGYLTSLEAIFQA